MRSDIHGTELDRGLQAIVENMHPAPDVREADSDEAPDNSLDDWNDKMNKEDASVGSEVKGDPSTWQVGQIIPSDVSGDYDGIILSIGEEDGEQYFSVMQIGPEGFDIPVSKLNLPQKNI